MKKQNKNPLAFFREQNEKRKQMFKKGGYNMPTQNLRKAQDGMTQGPFEEGTQKYLDTKYPGTAVRIPRDPNYVASPISQGWSEPAVLEMGDRRNEEKQMRSPGWADDFNTGMRLTEDDAYKKGGAVKKPKMKKGGNWIKGAIKKPGALRESLGVKKGETIPKGKLADAAKKGGKLGQRARLAMTLSKMRKG